jgi:photosystem II stability/assembly factor-like uncharacterized protein
MKLHRILAAGLALLSVACAMPAQALSALERPAMMSARASHSLMLAITQAGSRLVAVGDRGHILFSDDQGRTWQQGRVPVSVMLTAVSFPTAKEGWAVGHQGVILHTADAGASWQVQHVGSGDKAAAPLLDVWFADAQHGMAIGAYGTFLKTTDGGAIWTDAASALKNPDGWHLNAITAVPGTAVVLVAGERGLLFRSQDGGNSWQSLASPFDGSFFGIAALPGNLLLVYGLQGHLYRSTDNGSSWRALSTGVTSGLNTAVVRADGSVVVAGKAGVMLVSRDHGQTFMEQDVPDRQSIAAMQATAGGLITVGEAGIKLVGGAN